MERKDPLGGGRNVRTGREMDLRLDGRCWGRGRCIENIGMRIRDRGKPSGSREVGDCG